MKVHFTDSFRKDYQKLPFEVRNNTLKKIELLLKDRMHPSLRIKKIKGRDEIWEMSITMAIRLTFCYQKNSIILRRVGEHDRTLKRP